MIDCAPRTKNGQPDHSTIGVARANSTQVWVATGISPRRCPTIAKVVTIPVNGSVHQKRLVKSFSSGFSSSPSSGSTGSSVIPHFGQLPGWSSLISGCIGQV
jgi:hypothetical protein